MKPAPPSTLPRFILLLLLSVAWWTCSGSISLVRADVTQPLDSTFMLRTYCSAGSRDDPQYSGHGSSDNVPKKLTSEQQAKLPGGIALVALPGEAVPFRGACRGFKLLFVNGSTSEATFDASDGRLRIIREAMDEQGRWKPIEYFPPSGCGNSYHRVFLPAGHGWEFAAPEYTGTWKTRMRFVLTRLEKGRVETACLYSNEFEGSINPGQFQAQPGYMMTWKKHPFE